MLSQFMVSGYDIPSFSHLNDRLLYMDYIQKHYSYSEVSIDPMEAYRYQGNLYGLLKSVQIPASLYVYAMHLNGYTHPANYDGKRFTLKVPVKTPVPDY